MNNLNRTDNLWEKYISPFFIGPWVLAALVVVGVILRLEIYLDNPSFWLDETYVATQMTSRSFVEIFFNQSLLKGQPESPVIFCLLAKCSSMIFGNHELALRLIPFLSSSFALVLFALFLRRFYAPPVAAMATALAAFNMNLIYHAAELKIYSGDVLVAVAALWLLEWGRRERNLHLALVRCAYVGAVLLLSSNAALFFLPWIFVMLWLRVRKESSPRNKVVFIGLTWLWAITFLYLYFSVYSAMTGNEHLVEMWKGLGGFSSDAFLSWGWWKWVLERYVVLTQYLLPGVSPVLGLGLALVGIVCLTQKDTFRGFCVAGPIDLAILAAIVLKYPFYNRMILFLAPCLFICVAQGLGAFSERKFRFRPALVVCVLVLLLSQNVKVAAQNFLKDDEKAIEDNRGALEYLSRNMQAGDQLIINNEAVFSLIYYFTTDMFEHFYQRAQGCLYQVENMRILDSPSAFQKEGEFIYILERALFAQEGYRATYFSGWYYKFSREIKPKIQPGRVWVFLSHIIDPLSGAIDAFDVYGKRIQSFESKGVRVYLYEMR